MEARTVFLVKKSIPAIPGRLPGLLGANSSCNGETTEEENMRNMLLGKTLGCRRGGYPGTVETQNKSHYKSKIT